MDLQVVVSHDERSYGSPEASGSAHDLTCADLKHLGELASAGLIVLAERAIPVRGTL